MNKGFGECLTGMESILGSKPPIEQISPLIIVEPILILIKIPYVDFTFVTSNW